MLIFQNVGLELPASAGKIVSMCPYHDRVLIATEHGGLWEVTDDGCGGYSLRQQLLDRIEFLEKQAAGS